MNALPSVSSPATCSRGKRGRWIWRNEVLEGRMAPGDEARPGVMSPGRRRRGFSGCDGSTLKNTGVSFPPACALVSPSFRPTIFHFLCFTSCQCISLHSALFTSSLWVFSAYISLLTHFCPLCDLLAKAKDSLILSQSKYLLS